MKNRFLLSALILFLIGFYSSTSYSQTPTYTCTLANDVQVADNIYEFDIYLLRTGTTPLELAAAQFGFTYNNLIKNGGTLIVSWVLGSNDSALIASKEITSNFNTATPGIIKLVGKFAPGGPGTGAIITDVAPGIRFGRIRLTNTIAFSPIKPDIKFCNTGFPNYATKIFAYVSVPGYEITDSTKHFNNLTNPVFTGTDPFKPYYNCTLSNDVQVSDSLYEFDIYLKRTGTIPIELSGAQFGFTFNDQIRNGGTLTASFIPGTTDSIILNSGQKNIDFNTSTPGCIKIAPKFASGGAGSGAIISNTGIGTKIGRLRIANSVPFAILTPNINFCFTSAPYPTIIRAYVPAGGGGVDTSITDSTKHFKNLANPQLNGGIPDYQMLLANDAKGSDSIYEFDIYLLRKGNIPFELAMAQFGFTYNKLVKNG